MFTGIIQQIGRLAARETAGSAARLTIDLHRPWDTPLTNGESIAVNGVCLTVTQATSRGFTCDVLQETLCRTNLRAKPAGTPINLERALRSGDFMGGHLVSGHVDGIGTILRRIAVGRDWQLDIACEASILLQIVPKGSIACDGVSLTVSVLEKTFFSVNLIPHTWQNTALHALKTGDTINLETDMIGKYVFRWMEGREQGTESGGQRSEVRSQKSEDRGKRKITEDILRRAGFMN